MNPGSAVAVTGMAWRTALGEDFDAVWGALLKGRSGLRHVPFSGRLRNMLAAPVDTGDGGDPETRLVDMASCTIRRALAAAGRETDDPDVQVVLAKPQWRPPLTVRS